VKIYLGSECLNGRDDSGHKLSLGHNFEITDQGAESAMAELGQKSAAVLEEDPQHPGDGEDDLAVRDIKKKCLPHPLAPLLKPLGVARGTEPPGAAGEHQEVFRTAAGAPDPGKARAGVAAVEITLDHLFDDRPEKPVLLLEATLVF